MDELHGIFTAYEIRTKHENQDIKEAIFKASKRESKRKNNIAATMTSQKMMKKRETLLED
jgi:hypothetical protein